MNLYDVIHMETLHFLEKQNKNISMKVHS